MKYAILGLLMILVGFFFDSVIQSNAEIQKVKSGLEQCVFKNRTIWVKDCKSLLNIRE